MELEMKEISRKLSPFVSNDQFASRLLTKESSSSTPHRGVSVITASDTNLIQKNSKAHESSFPEFKYPKFIPLYNINQTSRAKKIRLNTSHPVPWFDIEASCMKMQENNTIADLSRYLTEGKLYPVNCISKKELKRLETRSNTTVNLDEAYTNQDVMAMYKLMHTIKKERHNLMKSKDTSLAASKSSTSVDSMDFDVDSLSFMRQNKGSDSVSLTSGTTNVSNTESTLSKCHDTDSTEVLSTEDELPGILTSSLHISSFDEIPVRRSNPSPRRFGDANETHCEAVSNIVKKRLFRKIANSKSDSPIVDLFVELVDGRIRPLCHIKTGMANLCLNSFFFPCTNIASVTWVSNIREILLKVLMKKRPLKDIFGKHIGGLYLNEVRGVLFLSEAAKGLIKHKDLCMLDTLCVTLGIPQRSLLLIDIGQKPADLI